MAKFEIDSKGERRYESVSERLRLFSVIFYAVAIVGSIVALIATIHMTIITDVDAWHTLLMLFLGTISAVAILFWGIFHSTLVDGFAEFLEKAEDIRINTDREE